jgi:hypothetical protein
VVTVWARHSGYRQVACLCEESSENSEFVVRGRDTSFLQKRAYRIWDPSSVLFDWVLWVLFSGQSGWSVKLNSESHPVVRLRMSGAVYSLSLCPGTAWPTISIPYIYVLVVCFFWIHRTLRFRGCCSWFVFVWSRTLRWDGRPFCA